LNQEEANQVTILQKKYLKIYQNLKESLTQLDDVVEPELDSEIKAEIDSYKAELNNE
jgi:C-terminal processing protease CtpA/Prc